MSKAILVMDMPKKCGDCPLCVAEGGLMPCVATKNDVGGRYDVENDVLHGTKFDKCPLKPMPIAAEENGLKVLMKFDDFNMFIGHVIAEIGEEENEQEK